MRITSLSSTDTLEDLELIVEKSRPDLVLFPERWSGGKENGLAELSDGPLARSLAAVAVQKHCAIMAPYLEREGQRCYSSVLFIGADGIGRCSYRKTHLGHQDLVEGVTRGNWMTIVPYRDERIGLLLGEDLVYPEMGRCLCLAGASMLIAATTMEPSMLMALARVRALENGVPVLAVSGGASGRMIACDPEAAMLADVPTPHSFDLDPVLEDRLRQRVSMRRSELYGAMLETGPLERA